jgi:hypothetical protein
VIVLDVVVVGAVALAAVRGWQRARAWEQAGPGGPAAGDGWWKNECAGVRLPPTRTPEESGLADREEVFGVVAGGRARAYRLAALSLPSRHVVNDVVGDTPVTVAYCDRTDCARVYTGPPGAGPLDVSLLGLYRGEMIVRIDGALYRHATGRALEPGAGPRDAPYPAQPPTRTTWGEWRRKYPETDVYVGLP